MATLDQINQGILVAAQKGDVESAKTLKAARDAMMAGGEAPAKEPSLVDRFVKFADDAGQGAQDFLSKHGRPLATGAGAIVGGVLAAPEAALASVPTAGLGGIATEAGGIGLGGAIGGNIYDRFAGKNKRLADQLKVAATDTATNAAAAPAGRLMGAAVDAAAPYVAPAAKATLRALSQGGSAAKTVAAKPFQAVARPLTTYLDAGATPAADAAAQAAQVADQHAGNLVGEARGYVQSQLDPLQQSITAAAQAKSDAISKATAAAGTVMDTQAAAKAAKDADAPLRAAMQAAADAAAASGKSPADTQAAQDLVATLRAKLKPNGPVAFLPTPDQTKVYDRIIETLSPESGPKPDLETIQNLRRQIAKPAYQGDLAGAGAIDKIERRSLVQALNGVEDMYTGNLQAPVQANYAKALDLEKQAEAQTAVAKDVTKSSAKIVGAADKTIQGAQKARQTYVTQLESLDNEGLTGQAAVSRTQNIVANLRKNGLISEADHREFVGLLSDADAAMQRAKTASEVAAAMAKTSAARKAIAKTLTLGAASVLGVGGVARGVHSVAALP